MASEEIKDEIMNLFRTHFSINDWDSIGKEICSLRGVLTHFNYNGLKLSNNALYEVFYELTQLFTIIINAIILKDIGLSKENIAIYQHYHFDNRSMIKHIDYDEIEI